MKTRTSCLRPDRAVLTLLVFWSLAGAAFPGQLSDASRQSETPPPTGPGNADSLFTPLSPLPSPAIIDSSPPYPGGSYNVDNMLDGVADGSWRSEYSSASNGTDTFIVFDFSKPTRISALKHVDRFDLATVATSQLVFSNDRGFDNVLATVDVKHANTRGGLTFAPFRTVLARYVRWKVTELGPHRYGTVGGSEIAFFVAGESEPAPVQTTIEPIGFPALIRKGDRLLQPFETAIHYPYVEAVDATLQLAGQEPVRLQLRLGRQTAEMLVPAVAADTPARLVLNVAGQPVAQAEFTLKPVRPWHLYILPHSHVDIGFTHVQTEVMLRQWKHLEQAMDLARRTADYPPGARFKWNSEVLWAVDGYLQQAAPEQQRKFIEAVAEGWIHLDALYGNELTALCRPEELFRLLDCRHRLAHQHGLTIDAAMISDVPGYTWGIVPALAHSGVKYLSIGPNHIHRIGYTLSEWGDRPFYWVSPSGRKRVLCWMAGKAYSWFHASRLDIVSDAAKGPFFEYLAQLAETGYPYDMVQIRYSIGGDNGPPDPKLPEFVKRWNAQYEHPKIVIATTREMFQEFERRYGQQVPEVQGDFTPYWEDGAGSSARETALARGASERLVQAETLWTILEPAEFPGDRFYDAWRNVILYNEHTWGAHCSISQPDSQLTKDQWAIKQAFATDAETQSRQLLEAAFDKRRAAGQTAAGKTVTAIDVYNTASWPRTDLVVLSPQVNVAGDVVKSPDGKVVPSQRLATGELALLADDVPPLGAKRFFFEPGQNTRAGSAAAEGMTLSNRRIRATIDENTGAIASLTAQAVPVDLVASDGGVQLNDYFYVPSRKPEDVQRNAGAKITVRDRGPLVASLSIESEAPGCRKLTRELRIVDGLDHLEITNILDKQKVLSKEAVHLGFAFHVPDGIMRMDTPWAVICPDTDQLSGACKNYFTVGRWVDVSNADFGVTWTTRDAPLVEVGNISVDVASPFEGQHWTKQLDPSQTLFSYVMNNYWETNYKASQEGPTTFRYAIRPHKRFEPAAAQRFGIERSQPLIAIPVDKNMPPVLPPVLPPVHVESDTVIVTSLKPSRDQKAWIVRLFNPGPTAQKATLEWAKPGPTAVWITDATEGRRDQLQGAVQLPGWGIVTLRCERPPGR